MPSHVSDQGTTQVGEHDDAATPGAGRGDGARRGATMRVVLVTVTVLAVLAGSWLMNQRQTEEAEAGEISQVEVAGAAPAPQIGEAAPDFTAVGIDGEEVRLSEIEGETWIVFMATWCAQCRVEAPDVEAAHAEGDGVTVIAVYVGEDADTVDAYAERLGLTFHQIPDADNDIARAYGAGAIPHHFFLDADGIVRDVRFGALGPRQIDEALATTR
ncbi:peroxiredoxin [Propioniferax innocua]|uniref:Peroxiredoxin n=2 Tax=Propioniferax innocua TaxID=1753 RepID=A0A542ZS88_9ACTN|nr:peroxiredoxin [Propioniferax innocua]